MTLGIRRQLNDEMNRFGENEPGIAALADEPNDLGILRREIGTSGSPSRQEGVASSPTADELPPPPPINQPASTGTNAVSALTRAIAPPPAPGSLEANVAELSSLRTGRAKDTNGRFKSALINALAEAGQGAQRALASGRPIDEYALAGVVGRGIGGAGGGVIDPSLDEERKRRSRMADLETQIGQQLAIEKEQAQNANLRAEADYRAAQPGIEADKIGEARRAHEQDEFYKRLGITERITKDNADLKQKDLDRQSREKEGRLDRESRERLGADKEKDLKVPDTFYRGKDDDVIKDRAISQVLQSGKYDNKDIRPELLDAYGNDQTRILKDVKSGKLKPDQVFLDPRKSSDFQRDLSSTYSTMKGDAQEFDRAVDMTSKSKSAQRISYADFETMWEKFKEQYKAAKDDKARNDVRRNYEQFVRTKRVIGD